MRALLAACTVLDPRCKTAWKTLEVTTLGWPKLTGPQTLVARE